MRLGGYKESESFDVLDFFSDFKIGSSDEEEDKEHTAYLANFEEKIEQEFESIQEGLDGKTYRTQREKESWVDRAEFLTGPLDKLKVSRCGHE